MSAVMEETIKRCTVRRESQLVLEAIDEIIYDAGLTSRTCDADEINRAAALRYLQRLDPEASTGVKLYRIA
jgi:hypothetical protein